MRFPKLVLFIFLPFFIKAQDSLPKTRLKLFDLTLAGTLTDKVSSNLSMNYVRSFSTRNPYYLSETFTEGFSDTTTRLRMGGPKRSRYDSPPDRPGSVYGQIGVNASFKFANAKHPLLTRLKPRIGIYHSKRRFFSYNIRSLKKYPTDTLFFTDPKYPPIIQDSMAFKNINYQYTSKQVFIELGMNVDVYKTDFFIFYTGILYGHGISYNNEFYMRLDEYDGWYKPYATTEVRTKEASSSGSRITVPMGILMRFSGKKFAPGFYAECSPGFESYRIKGGRTLSHPIWAFTWGFRFNFQKHRSS